MLALLLLLALTSEAFPTPQGPDAGSWNRRAFEEVLQKTPKTANPMLKREYMAQIAMRDNLNIEDTVRAGAGAETALFFSLSLTPWDSACA